MPEIGSSGLMSGDGRRRVGHRPQVTAPILDSTNADFKSFVLSVMKRTSDRAVMAVTCAHYKSVSKPTLNQPLSGTTSMSSAPGATCSPPSRQQLVEQKKP